MPEILSAGRFQKSPYYNSTLADGAAALVACSRMLLPRGYGDPEAEYWRLVNGVAMWDVAAQRQVQLKGPDACELAQILCMRDLSKQVVCQGKYVAMCDHDGVLINDPIAMKVADDCYWLSIGDSDIWFWSRCVAGERGLNVEITEPDVSPLAVQGPKAEDVLAPIFGDWIRDLRYFWFGDAEIEGIPLKIMRAGWSKQGGFELFLLDGSKGDLLWQLIKEAGKPFGIGPGSPNPSERIESGLLNWGVDTDERTNPLEVRMERFLDLGVSDEVIGVQALRRVKADGVKRHQLGILMEGDEQRENQGIWLEIEQNSGVIGHMTNKAWSYRLKKMIGFALVSVDAKPGDEVRVRDNGTLVDGKLTRLPFL